MRDCLCVSEGVNVPVSVCVCVCVHVYNFKLALDVFSLVTMKPASTIRPQGLHSEVTLTIVYS